MGKSLSYEIIGCAMKVYYHLGPGLLESAYEIALKYELEKKGFKVDTQVPLHFKYDSVDLGCVYRMDMVVEDTVIIELKSVEAFQPVHYKQLKTYLKLHNKQVGLLFNFGTQDFAEGFKRIVLDYDENSNKI
jgi:GxxExxY protein